MKFHIVITDTETGETFVDRDTCAIIGALDNGSEGTSEMAFTDCNAIDLGTTILGAIKAAKKAAQCLPSFLQEAISEEVKKLF